VKLFAEAEAAEKGVKHILHARATGQAVKRRTCDTQVLGDQHQFPPFGCMIKSRSGFSNMRRLAAVQSDPSLARQDAPGKLLDAPENRWESLAAYGRNRERVRRHLAAFDKIGFGMDPDQSRMRGCVGRFAKPD
jgi:hypothetical protein